MRLHKLCVTNFGSIEDVEIEFGPGLNVLYGPNDLGKSTVVAAIRAGMLLPHKSSHCEQYVGWSGLGDPTVEMTFETEAQRIWRVRKQFGKTGSSLLYESRNGRDFEEIEKARGVDGRLREILRWGVPEPGGQGGPKGLPTSFLATALLSEQDDVGAVLRSNLQGDFTASGKEQIAAALQAVAQDPLFVEVLKEAQARRDAAFTDRGAKKTAKGSVFKTAADRLNETRKEKERFEGIVVDSEGTENLLRGLIDRRTQKQEALAAAIGIAQNLELLADQTAKRSVAAEQVRLAENELTRIQQIGTDTEQAERRTEALTQGIARAQQKLDQAKTGHAEAETALRKAEESARAENPDSEAGNTVMHQQLALRKANAEQSALVTQQKIGTAEAAQRLVDTVITAQRDLHEQETKARTAAEGVSQATTRLAAAETELRRCDVLERAIDLQAAESRVEEATKIVARQSELNNRFEGLSRERDDLVAKRAAITVPPLSALGPMRQLATELAAARGALDVGLVVTVTPSGPIKVTAQQDGADIELAPNPPIEIEAKASVDLTIGDVAVVHVRGGRPEAQKKARELKKRWDREVQPHLDAAGVADLASLDTKSEEARQLDTAVNGKNVELESIRQQLSGLEGAPESLREATQHVASCRAGLGEIGLDSLAADLKSLGSDPVMGLRKRRQTCSQQAEGLRGTASQAANDLTLVEERVRHCKEALESAAVARDQALTTIPEGVETALSSARSALRAANQEKEAVAASFASLEREIQARQNQIAAALTGAQAIEEEAAAAVESAQAGLTTATTAHAIEQGRLLELRKQRDAENLAAAQERVQEVRAAYDRLPVPERLVDDDELSEGRSAAAGIRVELDGIDREILRTHGALEQVGGSVARERLRDATEAYENAARQEKEIEVEYDAWKLLLEQLKEADADQASNLGQVLGPAIAGRFNDLTRQRYEAVQLSAQLGTDGVVVSGAVRSTSQISVGTREQLSVLYRLSLAECLGSTIVLDDQLVQSDASRMEWFRQLLLEKARTFQVLVFTCRPSDYLAGNAVVPNGNAIHADSDDGLLRTVDLGRALRRR